MKVAAHLEPARLLDPADPGRLKPAVRISRAASSLAEPSSAA
jgi:hypothetical protein